MIAKRARYRVESLNGVTNTWQVVYEPGSQKEARKNAKDWERDVVARRAAGKVHLSVGVRVMIDGDDVPLLSRAITAYTDQPYFPKSRGFA